MLAPGLDLLDVAIQPDGEGELLHGGWGELAVNVAAPAPEGAVRLEGENVAGPGGAAGAHRTDLGEDLDGGGLAEGGAGAGLHDGHVTGAAVAQLSILVVAPGPERTVGLDGQGVGPAGADGGDVAHYLNGGEAVGHGVAARRVGAQLAGQVGAPGPEGAVGLEGQGMGLAGGHGSDGVHDLHRSGLILGGADPQLSAAVGAPGPEGAVSLDGQGVGGPGIYGGHPVHDLGGGGVDGVVLRPQAQLAGGVVAPGPEGTVGLHRQGVIASGGHAGDEVHDLYRGGAVGAAAVPQLTHAAAAPGPEGAVGFEGQGMPVAGGGQVEGAGVLRRSGGKGQGTGQSQAPQGGKPSLFRVHRGSPPPGGNLNITATILPQNARSGKAHFGPARPGVFLCSDPGGGGGNFVKKAHCRRRGFCRNTRYGAKNGGDIKKLWFCAEK